MRTMKSRAVEHVLRSVYAAALVYVFGVAFAALLAPLMEPCPPLAAAPHIALGLATFGFPVVAPIAAFAGVGIALVLSSRQPGWILLAGIILCSGLAGSWLFQHLRPFDLYHEADASRPGFETIEMFSSVTAIALLSSAPAISIAALLSRRLSR